MKVGIYETVEVSDEQRKAIAEKMGKSHATRDDLKSFIWSHGEMWDRDLGTDEPTDDDLLGEQDELDFEDLI